jgi:putative glutamine amidotransferase
MFRARPLSEPARCAPADVVRIGLPADRGIDDGMSLHCVADMYITALARFEDVMPVLVPAGIDAGLMALYLDSLDGLLLTGANSNINPAAYGMVETPAHHPLDPARDRLTLALVPEVLSRHIPVLGVCRGLQELNVALGGTLEAQVWRLPGRLDHRAPESDELSVCFAPRHEVAVVAGGVLHDIVQRDKLLVNSLHRQAVARLAPELQIEALAPDGTIEALSVRAAAGFALAVQWHPEASLADDAASMAIFTRFIDASRRYRRAGERGTVLRAQAVGADDRGVL